MKAFIDDHREVYGVEPICRVLPVAPSTYRAHAACRADPSRASARSKRRRREDRTGPARQDFRLRPRPMSLASFLRKAA